MQIKKQLPVLGALVIALTAFTAPAALAAPQWLEPVDVTSPTSQTISPDVGADGNGNVVAAWVRRTADQYIVEIAERSAGGSFSTQQIQTDTPFASAVRVAVNKAGDAIVVWDRGPIWSSYRPAGGAWETPQVVNDPAQTAPRMPAVAINDSGMAAVSFTQSAGGDALFITTRTKGGSWTDAQDLTGLDNWQQDSDIALDNTGKATVVWSFWDNEGNGGAGTNIARVRIRNADGSLGTLRNLMNGTVQTGAAVYPDVDLDAAGNAVAVWSRCTVGCPNTSTGPFDVEGAVRAQGSDTWSQLVKFGQGPAPYTNSNPKVAVDAAGNAIAVWIAQDKSVQAARRAAGGGFGTPQTGISAPTAEGIRVEMDNAGNAVAMWVRDTPDGRVVEASTRPAGAGASFDAVRTVSKKVHTSEANLAVDSAGNAVTVWSLDDPTLAELVDETVQVAAYDAVGPELRSVSVPGSGFTGDALSFSVNPFDVWSSVSTSWNFGDGSAGNGSAVSHSYAAPGSYTVTITSTDAVGNTASTTRTVNVAQKVVDADGDGIQPPIDCDDNNPNIKPTTPEIPDNNVDENCDGIKATTPPLRITSNLEFLWRWGPKYTTVTRLTAKNLLAGSQIEIRCKAKRQKACPFRTKKIAVRTAKAAVPLTRYFNFKKKVKGKRRKITSKIPVRGTIEFRFTKPGAIGKVVKFKIRRSKVPSFTVKCLPVGSSTPQTTC